MCEISNFGGPCTSNIKTAECRTMQFSPSISPRTPVFYSFLNFIQQFQGNQSNETGMGKSVLSGVFIIISRGAVEDIT